MHVILKPSASVFSFVWTEKMKSEKVYYILAHNYLQMPHVYIYKLVYTNLKSMIYIKSKSFYFLAVGSSLAPYQLVTAIITLSNLFSPFRSSSMHFTLAHSNRFWQSLYKLELTV